MSSERMHQTGDPGLVTSMCGWTSGLLLLYLAEGDTKLEIQKVDYCNSGDSQYGDKDEVVGYNAIVIIEKKSDPQDPKQLSDEINSLRQRKGPADYDLARSNIRSLLYDKKRVPS